MKIPLSRSWWLSLLVLAAMFHVSRAENAAPTPLDLPSLDALITRTMREKALVGVSVAIVEGGRLVFAQGYGETAVGTGQPVTTNTLFAIGSVSKQFTAACLLLLAEDGRLSVRDPVAKYYPDLTRAADITLLDLLHHVSGYPDYYPLDFLDRRMLQATTPDDVIRRYATGPLDFAPGSRWSYSNTGWLILGRVVEKVSGESFGVFLERRILEPLGMRHTRYEPEIAGDSFARGHVTFALSPPRPARREAAGWLGGAGAIYSTPADLARWDVALLEGRLLKPESFTLMTSPRVLNDGRVTSYGCGLSLSTRGGVPVYAHGGAVSGFLAENSFSPAGHKAVILLANVENPAAPHLHDAILARVLRPHKPGPAVAGPNAVEAAQSCFRDLQRGKIDRAKLGEEYAWFLSEEKLREASQRLKSFGKIERADLLRQSERGGMEVSVVQFTFRSGTLSALMYRSPDGLIQQFLLGDY